MVIAKLYYSAKALIDSKHKSMLRLNVLNYAKISAIVY